MRVAAVVLVILALAVSAGAQSYKIDWYVIGSGGGVSTSASYKLTATVGQPVAGLVENANLRHWIGFWVGDSEPPTPCATTAEAKTHPDGTLVSVSGKLATSAIGDFAGFFYIEESDRSSGIRVAGPPSAVAGLARGSVVNVTGTVGTTPEGERQIVGPMVIITSTTTPLAPVGMINKTVGGGDFGIPPLGQYGVTGGTGINNVGLLIKTWGEIVDSGSGYVVVDDGSGTPVRVDTTGFTGVPTSGYISVIGVSSLHTGKSPLILPRTASDMDPQ